MNINTIFDMSKGINHDNKSKKMNISINLTTEQRIEVLKSNREEILTEIYLVNGERSNEGQREIMTNLLEKVSDNDFYSNFLNSFEGVEIVSLLEVIEDERQSMGSDDSGAQDFFLEQTEKRMGTYSRKFD